MQVKDKFLALKFVASILDLKDLKSLTLLYL